MHFNTLFLVTALPFLVSSSPAQRRAASQAAAPSKRAFDFPDGCAFDPRLGNGFIDNAAGDGEGESCFGWPNSAAVTCGGPFDEKESNDVKEAVKQQATKDGQFKTSTVGDWTAAFQLLSTAFDDRDTSGFDKQFDEINVEDDDNGAVGQQTYYWSRHDDYIVVTRSGCPGGLFDKEKKA
ncbi:MAG: hypothetical protein LQ342_000545 [Letrouitia transgressa]|nr:MAG: hypothetical protein LQ342_000545 [Letrouitia transgressa]